MEYFPLFIDLKNRPCLVIGAGEIAARKIDLLIRAQASITVIAEKITPRVAQQSEQHEFTIRQKTFCADDLDDAFLIVSATDNDALNRHVSELANAHNILVNVVDNPRLCSFIFPAIVDRSPIIAAISSGGAAPVLARSLRAKLESLLSPSYGELGKLAEKYRLQVKSKIKQSSARRKFWEKVLQGKIAETVFAGRIDTAEQQLTSLLESQYSSIDEGIVYLVGAGPGDPDLLTFRALHLMQNADVIVYDRLVSAEILDLARRDAERIYVGKARDNHSMPQDSINQLLADLALQGKSVVRLKGGDPFIFGRGGEEIETLFQQGIHFQIVPGITAASGCASYAGIPLTHRDHAQSCTFVTGHLKDGTINLNWEQLARPNQTIVIYMGLLGLELICHSLIQHGCPPDHPVALVQQGTTRSQKVYTGTLATLPSEVRNREIKPPTLIIVGTVVSLHKTLNWFQAK